MSARSNDTCPFTSLECDGGEMYADGTVGCWAKESPDAACSALADVPDGMTPRDYYNETLMKEMRT